MDVAKGDRALAIEATGDDRAVSEDTKVVGKSVAKNIRSAVGRFHIGPGKTIAPLNVELLTDAESSCIFRPFAVKAALQEIKDLSVSATVKAAIPKSKNDDRTRF